MNFLLAQWLSTALYFFAGGAGFFFTVCGGRTLLLESAEEHRTLWGCCLFIGYWKTPTHTRTQRKVRHLIVQWKEMEGSSCDLTGVDCVWNVMAHTQKPDFVFRRNGRVHLNRRGRQFSRLLAAEVSASAVVMLDTPYPEVVWRVLATHSIRQFPFHFPSRASPCASTFRLQSTILTFAWRVRKIANTWSRNS
jgi:hypothetical protein